MIDAVVSGGAHATGYAHAGGGDAPVRIFYRLFGAPGATPVLIVHGLSFFSWDWIGAATRLATILTDFTAQPGNFWTAAAGTPRRLRAATHSGFPWMVEPAQDKAAPGNRSRPRPPRRAGGRSKATATA